MLVAYLACAGNPVMLFCSTPLLPIQKQEKLPDKQKATPMAGDNVSQASVRSYRGLKPQASNPRTASVPCLILEVSCSHLKSGEELKVANKKYSLGALSTAQTQSGRK